MIWNREIQILEQKAIMNVKTGAQQLLQVKKLRNIKEDIQLACFRRYLAACKYKHSLAFFKWREMRK